MTEWSLLVVAVLLAAMLTSYFLFDAKSRIRRDPTYASRGEFAASEDVFLPDVSAAELIPMLTAAMEQIGGKQIRTGPGKEVVYGWVGSYTTNLASTTEYQLLLVVHRLPGGLSVTCSARSRVPAVGLWGSNRSNDYVRRMASALLPQS